MSLSVSLSAESSCFSRLFFPVGHDPSKHSKPQKPLKETPENGAELPRSQTDPKKSRKGPFPLIPCSLLSPSTRALGWCPQQNNREVQAASGWGSVRVYPFLFPGNWAPAPAVISWAVCWDCPLLGQGKLGSHCQAVSTNKMAKSLLLTLLTHTSLPVLMVPLWKVISKAELPCSVGWWLPLVVTCHHGPLSAPSPARMDPYSETAD